jgi:hypothetical protein
MLSGRENLLVGMALLAGVTFKESSLMSGYFYYTLPGADGRVSFAFHSGMRAAATAALIELGIALPEKASG